MGIIIFELAYHETRRQQEVVEERDREFPSWRRRDVHMWSRIHFYPGAFCFMLTRLSLFLGQVVFTVTLLSIFYIGGDKSKPLTGWRFKIAKAVSVFNGYSTLFYVARFPKFRQLTVDEVDYSKYLGPDWKNQQFKGKRVSTICGNHTSNMDHFVLFANPYMRQVSPRWTPAEFCRKVPFMNSLTALF